MNSIEGARTEGRDSTEGLPALREHYTVRDAVLKGPYTMGPVLREHHPLVEDISIYSIF